MTRLDAGTGPPAPRTWEEQLMPQVPGASQDFVEQQLLWVLRDWCREGLVWIEILPNLPIRPDKHGYVLPSPHPNTAIGFVLAVRDVESGREYHPFDNTGAWRQNRETGGDYFHCPRPGMISFPYATDAAARLMTIIASIVPFTIHVPDWMRQHHQNAIETGVVGRLLMIPNKPWTSQTVGQLHWRQYLNMRNVERVRAQQAYVPATQQWSFPRFGV